MQEPSKINTYAEFWPFYLGEHSNRTSRILHVIGTSIGVICLLLLFITLNWVWFPIGLAFGYAFAWVGHFFFEKNRPATFQYPLWSFYSDFRLWALIISGKIRL